MTPYKKRPIYFKTQTISIHLKDDLLVELALLQNYGVIETLPFGRYLSSKVAKRQESGKIRKLVDLKKTNHLIRKDCKNNNFLIATLADAGTHLAGKKLFGKI